MGDTFGQIPDDLAEWTGHQHLFFVGTAPSGSDGHVNVSPKGGALTFRVAGPDRFQYLDLVGSGIETVAHLRDNGRIVVMFCSFEGVPRIVRLHGTGRVLREDDEGFARSFASFGIDAPAHLRSIIDVDVRRVSTSCGYAVPVMRFERERDQLDRWAEAKIRQNGPDAMADDVVVNNAESIDGLPGLDPVAGTAIDEERRAKVDSTGKKLLARPSGNHRGPLLAGRQFFDRKIAEGKTCKEAMRCLKRRIAAHVWRRMLADERRRATRHEEPVLAG